MPVQFWKDKKVFITGHTGFKGSWLSLWLSSLGADVRGFALPAFGEHNLFAVANVGSVVETVHNDIRNIDALFDAMKSFKPEIVFHLAAQSLVRVSYNNPVETYSTNVMGTVNLLDCVRRIGGIGAVVNVTSDKCYENKEWPWPYRESDEKGGFDPYSSSKGCAELVTDAYRRSFFNAESYSDHGCAISSVRAGNVIGGGDWAQDRLIPDILASLGMDSPILIRSPKSIRPWQHVLEPLSGYLLLAQKMVVKGSEYNGGWNFGPLEQDTQSVEWIAQQLVERWPYHSQLMVDSSLKVHEANCLKLDSSKARLQLNWLPKWRISDCLDRIIHWHTAWLSGQDMQQFSLNEIRQYTEYTANEGVS